MLGFVVQHDLSGLRCIHTGFCSQVILPLFHIFVCTFNNQHMTQTIHMQIIKYVVLCKDDQVDVK